jgi:hypothetical protein
VSDRQKNTLPKSAPATKNADEPKPKPAKQEQLIELCSHQAHLATVRDNINITREDVADLSAGLAENLAEDELYDPKKFSMEVIRRGADLQLLDERRRGLEGAFRAQLRRGAEIEPTSKEQKSLDDRDEKIWKIIQRGSRGLQYCRELDNANILPLRSGVWRDGPRKYAAAYGQGSPWRHRIEDEKSKIRRKATKLAGERASE